MTDPSSFDVEKWFAAFCEEAKGDTPFIWPDSGSMGHMMIEALSDSSNELFCTAILARHMRRYAAKQTLERFWVRCEWTKFDLSYGVATEPFSDWNEAWNRGITGDLGTIEVKVIYDHYASSMIKAKINDLVSQLAARRQQVENWRRPKPISGKQKSLGYHGLIIFTGMSDAATTTLMSDLKGKLTPIDNWRHLGQIDSNELSKIWPCTNINDARKLSALLVS